MLAGKTLLSCFPPYFHFYEDDSDYENIFDGSPILRAGIRWQRALFKEIFTVLYGQKRTQTMCKTYFETPKEQTRHGIVPKRDSFLLFF